MAGTMLDLFNYLDLLAFRLFVLMSFVLCAGLLLRPHGRALVPSKKKRE
jgi:hypothetical protein